jgi:hypothetical protein
VEHTSFRLPLSVGHATQRMTGLSFDRGPEILDSLGLTVANAVTAEMREEIVRAVNAHADLLEALREIARQCHSSHVLCVHMIAQDAIRAATGEEVTA